MFALPGVASEFLAWLAPHPLSPSCVLPGVAGESLAWRACRPFPPRMRFQALLASLWRGMHAAPFPLVCASRRCWRVPGVACTPPLSPLVCASRHCWRAPGMACAISLSPSYARGQGLTNLFEGLSPSPLFFSCPCAGGGQPL
eukprot:350337-Chlamydomonas_euryale.AAC.3